GIYSTCTAFIKPSIPGGPPRSHIKIFVVFYNPRAPFPCAMPYPYDLKRPYIPIHSHALYKFLINADGHVSSSRLGYIMQTNSVILKQRSPWIEYYYRSLVPGTHVLEYGPEDVLDLLIKYKVRQLFDNIVRHCGKMMDRW
ncbi:hypothetical protein Vafri_16612, partial [Volvox africanus]